MLKKKLTLVLFLIIAIGASAQYVVPNFRSADRYSSSNINAISIERISPISGDENGYEITFRDSQNIDRAVEQYATSFKFYLSYKGKRISDYMPCITSSFTLLYHEIVYTFELLNV